MILVSKTRLPVSVPLWPPSTVGPRPHCLLGPFRHFWHPEKEDNGWPHERPSRCHCSTSPQLSPVTSSALWIVDASGEYKTPTNIASTIVTFPHISHCLEMNPRTPTPMTPTEQERHDRTQQAAQPPSNLPSQAAGVHVAEEGPKQPTAKATVPPVKVESQRRRPSSRPLRKAPRGSSSHPSPCSSRRRASGGASNGSGCSPTPPPPYAMPGHAQANVRPQAANQAPFIHSAPQLPHPPAMSVHAPGVAGQSQQQQPPRVPMHVQPLVQVFLSPLQLQQLQMLMQAERGHPTQQQQQAQQEHPIGRSSNPSKNILFGSSGRPSENILLGSSSSGRPSENILSSSRKSSEDILLSTRQSSVDILLSSRKSLNHLHLTVLSTMASISSLSITPASCRAHRR
ncbi:hypothetical protein CPB85DRAFT_698781 [Mucidula mucida]|nr:hypothetical protein CPB85DRAFT_698781 [Mucidula mucida]